MDFQPLIDLFLDPKAWLLVVVLSVLTAALNLASYYLGRKGMEAVTARFPQVEPERWERASKLLVDRGSWTLVLAGVPGLSWVITTAAGVLGVRVWAFLLWVTVGMLVRHWLLVIAVVGGYHLLSG